jgi:hypothetical protein
MVTITPETLARDRVGGASSAPGGQDAPPLPAEFRQVDEADSATDSAAREVAESVGYELPGGSANPDLIMRDIAVNMRRSVESALAVGRGIAVLKAACGRGDFLNRLEILGVERTVAWRFMRAAQKFSNVATSQHWEKIGSQCKLFELILLDDEQVDELMEAGQTGGLALDDVERMSVSELRRAVRVEREKAREELEAEKKELADELAAAHRREANLSAEVEIQAGKIKRLESKERLTSFLPQTEAVRAECLALQAEAELPINAIQKLFESLVETPSHDDEEGLRLGHVFIAAQAVAARAAEMLRALQEHDYAASMPDRVTGEYIMSTAEAERWLADYRLIENRHEAAKALRQTAREEALPRGRGRPKGSKNKGAGA